MIIAGVILAIIGLLAFAGGVVGVGVGSMVAGAICFAIGVVLVISKIVTDKDEVEQEAKFKKEVGELEAELEAWKSTEYNSQMEKHRVPKNAKTVTVIKDRKSNDFQWKAKEDNYVFVSSGSVCLFPVYEGYIDSMGKRALNMLRNSGELKSKLNEYFSFIQIPIEDIEHFSIAGELFREQKISGGGGGGSDIGGAIVGGVIAGGAGAIIGSRKKTEEIKSKLVTHDTRETILSYFLNGNRKTIVFKHGDFQMFEDLIPEKNYDLVTEIKRQRLVQQSTKADSSKAITEQIKELAKLKDDGILTEDEYDAKKRELLARI
jgi:hypothetical protein